MQRRSESLKYSPHSPKERASQKKMVSAGLGGLERDDHALQAYQELPSVSATSVFLDSAKYLPIR